MSSKKSTMKLSQAVALDAGERTAVQKAITELHHRSTKPDLYTGTRRLFKASVEDQEELPPEAKKVQLTADTALEDLKTALGSWWDHVFTKDAGNAAVSAAIDIDGLKLENLPVPFVIWMEKQLTDVQTFVEKLPILDPAYNWTFDPNEGVYKTDSLKKTSTKKVPQVIVKYEATTEHPAQTELLHVDKVVGTWETTNLSGAIDGARKKEILGRIARLREAFALAREEANSKDIQARSLSNDVFKYILQG